ncbi:MAG TPA: CDP-alcohol phosphatidyltransferase family protein [Microlunatus sp.]|nr:CDP-alcohol phosphatidyltransferase family protein [Microlunatus sp.]
MRRAEVPWLALGVSAGAGLVGSAVLVAAGPATPPCAGVGLMVLLGGVALVAARRRARRLGWANAVTLGRLVGVGWITALTLTLTVGSPAPAASLTALIIIAAVCLALDGVDGAVARARGEASEFGARFDMETDAAMIMILCVAVAAGGGVGAWVLAIGLFRYVYWLASFRVAALRVPLPPSLLRKAVAVAQSIALLSCLLLAVTGVGPSWLPAAVAGLALAGLAWSFVSVIVAQLRAAR